MNEQMVTSLLTRLDALEARMATYRQGLVTATTPNIQVQLGGATTSYTNVSTGVPVAVGDVVACLMLANGHDMLIVCVLSGSHGREVPIGTVAGYVGSSDPPGGIWLIADNRSLLRSACPGAFALWGTDFGSVDGTHFNMPDYEDCVLVGAGGVIGLNDSGGSNTSSALLAHVHAGPSHVHTEPAHGHNLTVDNGGGGSTAIARVGGAATQQQSQWIAENPSHNTGAGGTGNTSSAGSGSSFSIMQKHVGANFIVRVL